MKRPGFLAGYQSMTSRASHNFSGVPEGLGFFGKGAFVPPPGPPGSPSMPRLVTDAVNRQTGRFYMQDPRCGSGMKMTPYNTPCVGADCDPGERDVGDECDDDPAYKELPPPPAQGFFSCEAWVAAGYPSGDCNQRTCPSCFTGSSGRGAMPMMSMPLMPMMMAPGGIPDAEDTYTGGGGPGYSAPRQTTSGEEKREQRLEQLVSAHETSRAMARATGGPRVMPKIAGSVSRPSAAATAAPSKGPPESIFTWLQETLFGPSGSGFGRYGEESKFNWWPIMVVGSVIYVGYVFSKPSSATPSRITI